MAERLTHLAASVAPLLSFMPGVNVQTFGATGDGTTDDTVALQDAISGSGTLWIPGGTYIVSRPLVVGSNTRLIGQAGATFYRIAGVSATTCGSVIVQSNGSNVTIEGLTIDGQVDAYAAGSIHGGIVFINTTNGIVRQCTVTRTVNAETTAGIYFETCHACIAEDCYLYDNDRTAAIIRYGENNKFIHCTARDNAGSGFAITEAVDCTIDDCTAYSNGYSNITVNGLRGSVIGCKSYLSTYTGIVFGHAGVDADPDGHPASDSVCIGNQSYNNTLDGISVANSQYVCIEGNTVFGNQRRNIQLYTWGAWANNLLACTITNNTVYGTGLTSGSQIGIYIEKGLYHVITGNRVTDNQYSGIYLDFQSGSSIVANNICKNNNQVVVSTGGIHSSGSGIVLAQSFGNIVTGNLCLDDQATPTQGYGIRTADGGNHSIGANRTSGNMSGGIVETGTPTGMTYFDNVPAYP